MKLYRATNRKSDAKKIPVNSCWTDTQEDAQAYTDNPGFGGKYIVSVNVDLGNVADWTDGNGGTKAMIRDLVDDADDACDMIREWGGYDVFQTLENATRLSELAAEKYDWVIYTDDYPEGCTTYRRMRW